MAVLPAGVRVTDEVAVPRTAGPGRHYHRPATVTAAGCGVELVTLTGAAVYLAVGMGCAPCPGCWPSATPPIVVDVPGGPLLLRPAVPGLNPAGYRSAFGHGDRHPVAGGLR